MDEGFISRRYAKALLKFAGDRGTSEQIYQEAKHFERSSAAYADLRNILLTPVLSAQEKERILLAAAGAETDSDMQRFVRLVIKNRRETHFRSICLMYQKLYRELHAIEQVKIITAVPVERPVLEKIESLIAGKSDRQVEFIHEVDPSLIGGFVLECGSMQLDASVNHELKILRLNLLK